MRDIFNRLLITSDPFIPSLRKLPKKKSQDLPKEVTDMLSLSATKDTSLNLSTEIEESDFSD